MDIITILYGIYVILGLTIALFNKFFALWIYRLILVFTDKLQVSEMFLFKIDNKNKDTFYFLIRSFCILFGLILAFSSGYFIIDLFYYF